MGEPDQTLRGLAESAFDAPSPLEELAADRRTQLEAEREDARKLPPRTSLADLEERLRSATAKNAPPPQMSLHEAEELILQAAFRPDLTTPVDRLATALAVVMVQRRLLSASPQAVTLNVLTIPDPEA